MEVAKANGGLSLTVGFDEEISAPQREAAAVAKGPCLEGPLADLVRRCGGEPHAMRLDSLQAVRLAELILQELQRPKTWPLLGRSDAE